MESRAQPEYLVIGHVTRGLTQEGSATGGTAAYSGLAARALGLRTAVVTSAGPDFDTETALPGLDVKVVPAAETTTFENIYTPDGRKQFLHNIAGPITAADIPPGWLSAPIVHLGPLIGEFNPEIIHHFSNAAIIGITPQGWLRQKGLNNEIIYKAWQPVETILSRNSVLVVSTEDLPASVSLRPYRQMVPILVQTHGRNGCIVYEAEKEFRFPAPAVRESNPTGAGDIFTTAFLIKLHRTGSVAEAAVFANKIAGLSVGEKDLADKISLISELGAQIYD